MLTAFCQQIFSSPFVCTALVCTLYDSSILIKQIGICLLTCLSRMAGHALYGMAPCFGHTGVPFNAENDRPGPGSLQGHFEVARGHFLRLKALF